MHGRAIVFLIVLAFSLSVWYARDDRLGRMAVPGTGVVAAVQASTLQDKAGKLQPASPSMPMPTVASQSPTAPGLDATGGGTSRHKTLAFIILMLLKARGLR